MTLESAKDPAQISGPSVRYVRRSYVNDLYPALVRNNRLRASELRRLRDEASNFGYRPVVSVLLPVTGTQGDWLDRTLDSVVGQIYPGWELCLCGDGSTGELVKEILSRYERLDERIKVDYLGQEASKPVQSNMALSLATGEFVGLLAQSDELAPDALFEVVKLLQKDPGVDLVYSDVDSIDGEGNRSAPYFKPGWSPDLLLSANYVSQLSVYRRSILEEVGGFRHGFDGCEDYDLTLRFTERTDRIQHVPKVLYHRRSSANSWPSTSDESSARGASHRALSEALERRGLEGSVEEGIAPGRLRVRLKIEGEPKVSLIIPTRDNVSLLKNCVESVERRTTYRNYEILIVDNGSVDPTTVDYLASTSHRVLRFEEEFNYSRINNFAVSHAGGKFVLFLNDDTEVISGEWLEALLEHAQRSQVGAVGAKLVYPDGRIQHAGVLVGAGNAWGPGVAAHSHQFYPSTSFGYASTVATTTNYSAVTAACMLVRKSVFDEVGGFDEENLRVSFNDVDLCLRMRERGYRIIYTPHAELYHHESVSRGYRGDPAELRYMRERWGGVLDEEPYYNPNFSRGSGDFNLRADILRPRVLRPETGYQDAGSPLTTSQEDIERYLEAQRRLARDSRRTTLVPKSTAKPARVIALEDIGKDAGTGQTQSTTPDRTRVHGVKRAGSRSHLRSEQLIWMFGSPRTGSTWLSRMMAELDNQERWHEPYVGLLFGSFIYERLEGNEKLLNNPSFIMGEPYRDIWLGSIRHFLLEGAAARYPRIRDDQYLVIKEPNGSVGAPLLMEATPESRMIFLIRDPRDVVASRLDAFRVGAWSAQNREYGSDEKVNAFTKHLADDYVKVVSQTERAFEAHRGKKSLVRYEDLRDDTISTLKDMYAALEIEVDEPRLEAAVAKHSWEQIPESQKGEGKFYRKAEPGSWRSDLSPDQIRIVEKATDPVLSRYYRPGVADRTFSG